MKPILHRIRRWGKSAIRKAPLSDTLKEKILFRIQLGYWPNFEDPSSFCEKLHSRKLLERDPRLADLSDKLKVRKYVAAKVGAKYLVPLKFSGSHIDPATLHSLGDDIVIKRNDDSGSAVVLKQNTLEAATTAVRAVTSRRRYGKLTNEWWYDEIPAQILVEDRLSDASQVDAPYDYRFFVFASKSGPSHVFVEVIRRLGKHTLECGFFDSELNPIFIDGERVSYRGHPLLDQEFPAKELFGEMKSVALRLSEGFSFVRIDLYAVNGKIYFGEMTFNPAEGRFRVRPVKFDFDLGKQWELPISRKNLHPVRTL